MPDGQDAGTERGLRAFENWLRMSLPEDQVQRILTGKTFDLSTGQVYGQLYNYYAQLFANHVAAGRINPQDLLQPEATTAEQQAAASKLTQSQAELSNWLLKQYKDKYLPWRIANEGLTEEEADILYGELRDELFPKIPQTQEEKLAWYTKNIGQAPPYGFDESGNIAVDWSAIDSTIAAKGVQPTPVTQTRQYRDFTGWRENQLGAAEKQALQVEETQARQKLLQASQIASDYGISQSAIQGLAPDMADQWMQAQFETYQAQSKQWQEQEARRREDTLIAMREAESRRIEAQQTARQQGEIQRQVEAIQKRLEGQLLPMLDFEKPYGEAVSGLVSPAMRQFYKGKAGEVFAGAGMEEAMTEWWKTLNAPAIEQARLDLQTVGGQLTSPTSFLETAGLQSEFGLSPTAAMETATRYLLNPGAPEFATLPTGGRAALEAATGAARGILAEEEVEPMVSTGIVRKAREAAAQPSPWESYLTGKDWFREFFGTPRAYRPGGYAQRGLAPSIRRF